MTVKKGKDKTIESKRDLSIYIHIPFCVKKCYYCDFLSFSFDDASIVRYVHKLREEIEMAAQFVGTGKYIIRTIFIGGGTPSLLSGQLIESILFQLKACFSIAEDAEISMEMNPGTVTKEKLTAYKKAKINRISIGLQSANNEELRLLGRIHTFEDFMKTYSLARETGFHNINIDIMSALPNQTCASFENTLKQVVSLKPEHISAYSLIVEENTPFYDWNERKLLSLPDEETDRAMYELTGELLEKNGYLRYEISNYAKENYTCRHNKAYWQRKEYLGLGLGAASCMEETRWRNEEDFNKYLENAGTMRLIRKEVHKLSTEEQMEEFMFLGLRMTEGVSGRKFKESFGISIQDIYTAEIEFLLENCLIANIRDKDDSRYFLTKRGIDISNFVFEKFLR